MAQYQTTFEDLESLLGSLSKSGVTYDDLASTSWGLTQAQVNARIFTEEA